MCTCSDEHETKKSCLDAMREYETGGKNKRKVEELTGVLAT